MIILALDMPDICGEFRDICKVSLLPARTWVRSFGHAESYWLVVSVGHKTPAF